MLIVGNGLFKPNVGSLLGPLYEKDDPRRESGFTIFYLGINSGAFVATLIAGWIGLGGGLVLIALVPVLKRMMGGATRDKTTDRSQP